MQLSEFVKILYPYMNFYLNFWITLRMEMKIRALTLSTT